MNVAYRILRLLWIEIKRCQGVFLAVLVVANGVLFSRETVSGDIVIWQHVSFGMAYFAVLAGCVGAGFAAWQAGRMRRSRTMHQMQSAAIRFGVADLLLLIAVVSWMLIAYLAVAGFALVIAMNRASWGGPDLWVLLAGAVAMIGQVAVGYLVGFLVRSAIAAPVTVMVFLAFSTFGGSGDGSGGAARIIPGTFLSSLDRGVFYEVQHSQILPFALSMAGIAVLCGLLLLILRHRTLVTMAGACVALGAGLFGTGYVASATVPDQMSNERRTETPLDCRPFDAFTVCLHPAYAPAMDEIGASVLRVMPPFAGLPGVPAVFEQSPNGSLTLPGAAAISVHPGANYNEDILVSTIFQVFIEDGVTTDAELAMIQWLIDRSGLPMEHLWLDGTTERSRQQILRKAEWFAAQTPEQQRAWLETNWNALRAGEIALEEMP
jgi:hypothetical protein